MLCKSHLLEGMNVVKLALDAVIKIYVGEEETEEQENLIRFIEQID